MHSPQCPRVVMDYYYTPPALSAHSGDAAGRAPPMEKMHDRRPVDVQSSLKTEFHNDYLLIMIIRPIAFYHMIRNTIFELYNNDRM